MRALVNSCGRGVEPATVTRDGLLTERWGLLEPPALEDRGRVGDEDVLVVSSVDASHPDVLAAEALGFRVNLIPVISPNLGRLLAERGAVVVYHGPERPNPRLVIFYPDSGCYFSASLRAHVASLRRRGRLPRLVERATAQPAARAWPAAVVTHAGIMSGSGWGVGI